MPGRCPNCETTGPVGTPCRSPTCASRRLHLIPEADAARHRAAAIPEPLVGTFVGDFLVTRLLDKGGGFGRILLGLQRPLFETQGAIKLLHLERHEPHLRGIVLEKFEHEARVLGRVRHTNVVRSLQYGLLSDDTPFLVMEYIPGARTLTTEVGLRALRGERLETQVLRKVVDQLARALDSIHKLGLIHRDLKPDNIMLEEVDGDPWHVKLVDFGLAKSVAESSETRFVTGTRGYMAPEQLERKNLGPATDVYAFALIVLELWCCRRLPTVGISDLRSGRVPLDTAFDPAARLASLQLTSLERNLFTKALARDPAQRFASATEFAAAFEDVVGSAEVTLIRRGDLSALIEPEDVSHLKREAARLESERLRLESERVALAAEVERLRRERKQTSDIPPPLPSAARRSETHQQPRHRPRMMRITVVASALGVAALGVGAAWVVTRAPEAEVGSVRGAPEDRRPESPSAQAVVVPVASAAPAPSPAAAAPTAPALVPAAPEPTPPPRDTAPQLNPALVLEFSRTAAAAARTPFHLFLEAPADAGPAGKRPVPTTPSGAVAKGTAPPKGTTSKVVGALERPKEQVKEDPVPEIRPPTGKVELPR